MSELPPLLFEIYLVCLVCLLGYAAYRDVATRLIPDRVSIALAILGMAIRLCSGWSAFGVSIFVAATLFTLLLPFCSRGVLGGADLKLIAALAIGLPPQTTVHLLLAVTLMGGLLAGLYVVAGKIFGWLGTAHRPNSRGSLQIRRIATIEFWRIRRHAPLPYAVAIAVGATFVVLQHQGV